MSDPTTITARPGQPVTIATQVFALVTAGMAATGQRRTGIRLAALTIGALLTLGRRTVSQVVLVVGAGTLDWTAWYRLFSRRRVRTSVLQRQIVAALLAELGPAEPLVVAVDGTQLPRSSRRFPGVGWSRAPRCPAWMPGVHLSQRISILSGLAPRSADGTSRAIPIRDTLLRSPKVAPVTGVPIQTEAEAGVRAVRWLRALMTMAMAGERDRPILLVADGAYSVAAVVRRLPRQCWLVARCAKNRALFAMPDHDPHRPGRKRCYGLQGPTPHQTLLDQTTWKKVPLTVRGRSLTLRVAVTGPWLIRLAPDRPLMLVVVRGVQRTAGATRYRREPTYLMVTARQTATGTWILPLPLAEVLAWFWQRWEVEVMHRELKTSFGFGDQQAWTVSGTQTTRSWVLWTYAILILAAIHTWGMGPPPGPRLSRWYRPRRWSIGHALQTFRAEVWRMEAFHPVWARSPDVLPEITAWLDTQTNAILGQRHI